MKKVFLNTWKISLERKCNPRHYEVYVLDTHFALVFFRNELVAPIEEAAKVVETLTEARSEKIKRVQIAEREKAGLESAKLEAESLLGKHFFY